MLYSQVTPSGKRRAFREESDRATMERIKAGAKLTGTPFQAR